MTEADLAADRVITEGLKAARPSDPILSEESHWMPGSADDLSRGVWCVDPIDGTEAFIDPNQRGYAVQIAYLERVSDEASWRPVVGVVFEPNHDELFAAVAGGELIFERRGQRAELAPAARGRARVLMSSRAPKRMREALLARGFGDAGTRRSVGIKVGFMLKGAAEIYPAAPALAYWDLAAPQVILEAAGGRVSDAHGRTPSYRFEGDVDRPYMQGPTLMTIGVDHDDVLATFEAVSRELRRA